MACGKTKRQTEEEMCLGKGRRGHAKAGAPSPPCPAPCAGASLVIVLMKRCLTPVPGDGEGRGTRPRGFSPCARRSFPKMKYCSGFMSHICHLVALGTIAEGPTGQQWPRCVLGCPAPSASSAEPRVLFCFTHRGPKSPWSMGDVTLSWPISATLPPFWCSPESPLAGRGPRPTPWFTLSR